MVSAYLIEVKVSSEIQSIVLCLFVRASSTTAFAHLILLVSLSFGFFSCFDSFGIGFNRFNTLAVVLTSNHREEVLEKNMVVPLWLVENLSHLNVQVIENREDLPHTQHNPNALKFYLEELSVDSLVQKQVQWELLVLASYSRLGFQVDLIVVWFRRL